MSDLISSRAHEILARSPRTVVLTTSLVSILAISTPWLVRNYRAYLALGPSGLPFGVFGWAVSTLSKPFGRETTSTGVYDEDLLKESWLEEPDSVPLRKGARPKTGWHFLPHRQVDQHPDEGMKEIITTIFSKLASFNSNIVELAPSPHEKIHQGMVIHHSIPSPHQVAVDAWREIVHVHSGRDYSLHLILAPQDCKLVIERGWGERHPLSGVLKALPSQYLMVYAPRDDAELDAVEAIVKAAIGYMTNSHDVIS
ncbi:hypothetical protein JAAARDRAFT_35892 [Jaapia argillacea MUCL 33604]|uniref:Luciferase domain-containing protein n=1 Tax=Jaapia argillacea MUCL 33604 TaxID=933084 RepID=A0A067PTU5_9AGAM|nr:hypothetical protein JAAARDRAFT_35892 [Jaapia argillacea MUCL 33604]